MTQTLARPKQQPSPITIEQALVSGDLSRLDAEQRVNFYLRVCTSLALNPLTRPFDYLMLNGKLVLYARKDATDQLRKTQGVSIVNLEHNQVGTLYVVTATAQDKDGRKDSEIGVVSVEGLKGEALSNAMMKASTKAKRRVTLSLCGLGMTDESEVDSIPGAYYPEPDSPAYVPTKEREVDDRDLVRSADETIWKRWLQILAEAQSLGLNSKTVTLPIDRDELKQRGSELRESISQRQEQLDNEEVARQQAKEGLRG